jgi:hypothetical protein
MATSCPKHATAADAGRFKEAALHLPGAARCQHIDVTSLVAHLLLLLLLPRSVANEVNLMMSFAHRHVVCAYHFVTWKRRSAKEATGGTDLDVNASASALSCMLVGPCWFAKNGIVTTYDTLYSEVRERVLH